MRLLLAAVALVLATAACDSGGPLGPDLDGTWVLTAGTGPRGAVEVPADARIDLTHANGQFRGTAACNSYFADVDRDGASITIGEITATEMACDEPRMTAEHDYLTALGQVTSAARDGDTLTLAGEDVELVFTLEPPAADASPPGTTSPSD